MVRLAAILKLSKRVKDVIAFADHVVERMTGNPAFPAPKPTLKSVAAHVETLRRAEAATLSRTVGTVATRDGHHAKVRADLEQLRAYVQTLADAVETTQAAVLIKSAGFFLKSRAGRGRQTLSARTGRASGIVRLTAAFAGKVALYEWAYSLDQKKWLLLPPTTVAKTTVESLTPGTTAYFRTRALRRAGMGDWSTPIAFIIT